LFILFDFIWYILVVLNLVSVFLVVLNVVLFGVMSIVDGLLNWCVMVSSLVVVLCMVLLMWLMSMRILVIEKFFCLVS